LQPPHRYLSQVFVNGLQLICHFSFLQARVSERLRSTVDHDIEHPSHNRTGIDRECEAEEWGGEGEAGLAIAF
jgi:hypothetical protein